MESSKLIKQHCKSADELKLILGNDDLLDSDDETGMHLNGAGLDKCKRNLRRIHFHRQQFYPTIGLI